MAIKYEALSMLPEQYRKQVEAQVQKQAVNRAAKAAVALLIENVKQVKAEKGRKQNKYRNKPTTVTMPNGKPYTFDSRKEAERYEQLMLLQKAGEIYNLRLQPQFTLKESYITDRGDRSRSIIYKADFSYIESGTDAFVVEDVKSEVTRKNKDYLMKKKMMQELKGITVKEV